MMDGVTKKPSEFASVNTLNLSYTAVDGQAHFVRDLILKGGVDVDALAVFIDRAHVEVLRNEELIVGGISLRRQVIGDQASCCREAR